MRYSGLTMIRFRAHVDDSPSPMAAPEHFFVARLIDSEAASVHQGDIPGQITMIDRMIFRGHC